MNMIDNMASINHESVKARFDRRALDGLIREASEVVIFGSRAVGVQRSDSDLDVLVVTGQKRRVFASGLDCVLMTAEDIDSSFWLGSELASHVAKYGNWVKGSGEWRFGVHIGNRALTRKQNRLSSLLRNAAQRWSRLHPVFQAKYRITIRRELQRLKLLSNQVPIPPTPLLDSEWQFSQDSNAVLFELALNISRDKSYASELELIFQKPAL